MPKSKSPFANLTIDRDQIAEVVNANGGEEYQLVPAGTSKQLQFKYGGVPYCMAAYFNKDGTTTLSCLSGRDQAIFETMAAAIRDGCAVGQAGRFEVSIPRFSKEKFDFLLQFLTEEHAEIQSDETTEAYRLLRLKGRQGDTLAIKLHANATLQFQGRRAMLAAVVLDALSSVLDYKSAVAAQMEAFKVDLRLSDVRDELEGKWNSAFKRVPESVRTQLTTALALTKVDIDLPDYSPIAFPALRGLEGFLKSQLETAGLDVNRMEHFGEYFEHNVGIGYKMRSPHDAFVGPVLAPKLASCYTVFHAQRHGIAHMDTTEMGTRTLKTLTDAQQIVFNVFDIIERF